jgi:hypothetical protein
MTFDKIVEALNHGHWLHYGICGPREGRKIAMEKWRYNGHLVTYKRDPSRNYIPIKHGLRDYSRITASDHDLDNWHIETECPLLSKGTK